MPITLPSAVPDADADDDDGRNGATHTAGGPPLALPAIVGAIAVLALFFQLRAYPNHDVAWILWGARQMLHGAVWGRDIIEPNPPLAWYLSMPSVALADFTGLPIAATFAFSVAAAALLSIWAFDRLIARDPATAGQSIRLPTIAAALFLFLFPYRDFGQREHLALIAALPWLALATRRIGGDTDIDRGAAITVGIAAGIGFALKPYFLAVPLAVEIAGMTRGRARPSLARPETLAIAGVMVAYIGVIFVSDRDYITSVVPLASAIYWSFDIPFAAWVAPLLFPLAVALLTLVLRWPSTPLMLVTVAATAGFAVSCFVQHKGYSYHLLPVRSCAALALAAALAARAPTLARRLLLWMAFALIVAQSAALTARWSSENGASGERTQETGAILDAIDRHARGGQFLVVAVHPYPAFPTALYASARQVSRTNSQWFLPAVAQLRAGRQPPRDDTRAIAEQSAHSFIRRDLEQSPDLVIVDADASRHTVGPRDFDILSFYAEDPAFRALWSHYREIPSSVGYRLFVRQESAR